MVSDQDYIQAANAGDPAGFEGLYHRYRDWVYQTAWRFTGNHSDALDVLQETFAYLLEKFPGFTLSSKMTTFLYPVVKHLALTARKKNRRCQNSEEVLEVMTASLCYPPETDGQEEITHILTKLPEKQREVLLLRFVDDLTLEEIAAALTIPLGTVKSRLHQAITELRQTPGLRNYFHDQ